MKNLIALKLLVLSFGANALDMNVETQGLSEPTYLNNSALIISLGTSEVTQRDFPSSRLNIEYLGPQGESVTESISMSFEDIYSCIENKSCSFKKILRPGLERKTCSIKTTLITQANNAISENEIAWGDCLSPSSSRYIDLNPKDVQVEITRVSDGIPPLILPSYNLNLTGFEVKYEYAVIGRDANGLSVYSGRKYSNSTEFYLHDIRPSLFNKLCSLEVIGDPYGKLNDPNLGNNHKDIHFGNCHTTDQLTRADLNLVSQGDVLFIFNQNDYSLNIEKIKLAIDVFDKNDRSIFSFARSVEGNLGYFDYSMYSYSNLLQQDGCRIEFSINPTHSILESNFSNNFLTIDRCN